MLLFKKTHCSCVGRARSNDITGLTWPRVLTLPTHISIDNKWEVPETPSILRVDYFIRITQRTQDNIYLIDDQFVIKNTLRHSQRMRSFEQDIWEETLSLCTSILSQTWKLSERCPCATLQRFHYISVTH